MTMTILVVDPGSSTLKLGLLTPDGKVRKQGTLASKVSSGDSQLKTLVVAAREDLKIAREIRAVVGWGQPSPL
jgi:acetate kinase